MRRRFDLRPGLGEIALAVFVYLALVFKFCAVNDAVVPGSHLYLPSLFTTLGTALPFVLLPLLLPRRLRGLGLLGVDLLLTALVFTDLLSFRYYTDLFTLRNLGLSSQVGEVADSVLALLRREDALLLLDLPLAAVAAVLLALRGQPLPVTRRRVGLVLGGSLLALLPFAGQMGLFRLDMPAVVEAMWDRPAMATGMGALGYHLADLGMVMKDLVASEAVAAQEEEAVVQWVEERDRALSPEDRSSLWGCGKGRNLVMIQVEALQQFVLGRTVGGVEITPHLNRFLRECLYFPNTYNQTALGNSADAEFMANTSLFPSARGVAYTRFAGNRYVSLGSVLRSQGYRTLALHGDRPGFWNRHRMYPALGFDRYVSKNELRVDEVIGLGLSDRSFLEQSLRILRSEKQPFYAFLVTLTSHYPYNFPELPDRGELPLGDLKGSLLGDYLRFIHYTDRQLGAFLEGMRACGLLDRSVVVLYGDHTAIPSANKAELGAFLKEDMADPLAWRAQQTIPLMVRVPGAKARGIKEISTGQMDIAPTVASLLGARLPVTFGQDLLEASSGRVAFRNGSFLQGNVWVQPEEGRAVSLKTGRELPFAAYAPILDEVRTSLRFSDLILEQDLLPRICRVLP